MRQVTLKLILRVLITIASALVLMALALGSLASLTKPAQASNRFETIVAPTQNRLPPARPLDQAGVSISKRAITALDPTNGATVAAGGFITYEISLVNSSADTLSLITITDELPSSTLADLDCLTGEPAGLQCTVLTTTKTIPIKNPDGSDGVIIQEVILGIQWALDQLGPGESAIGRFTGKVICRPEGFTFLNFAFAQFKQGGNDVSVSLDEPVPTTVQIVLPSQTGASFISDFPTFCSQESDTGGFYDMDWADYDVDGDLDLALISGDTLVGLVVYRNNGNNQFTRIPVFSKNYLSGVRWIDYDKNNRLDLLTVGNWRFETSAGPTADYSYTGFNYIFENQGNSVFTLIENGADGSGQPYTFQSNDGMFRTAVADYDNDTDVDIALGNTYAIDNGCGIQINRNLGGSIVEELNVQGDWSLPTAANGNLKCLQEDASIGGLDWGDYNNDGLLDLAVGIQWDGVDTSFNRTVSIFSQIGTNIFTTPLTIFSHQEDPSLFDICFPYFINELCPYDLRWGDYDNDGNLDLAVALGNEIRIYDNEGAPNFLDAVADITIITDSVRAIDWVDIDGDGQLELAVGSRPIRICDNLTDSSPNCPALATPGAGDIYAVRGSDPDNDGDLDISYTNVEERAFMATNIGALLDRTITNLPGMGNGTSVAWGDVNGDGFKTEGSDLMVGGNPLPPGTTFYYNTNGRVSTGLPEEPIKFFFPANGIALHDVNSDGDLDIVAATGQAERIYQFDQPGDAYSQISSWRSTTAEDSRSLVMSDFNQDNDGVLELMVANVDTPSTYYLNPGLQLETSSPNWYTPGSAKSYSIAWGYLDNDIFPDVAIGNYGQANQVYHNNGDNTFSLVEWNPNITTDQTRSVAWGDYDADGDMDLAVGNEGEPNYIYENQNGTLSATYVWSFTLAHNTTSLAWGDWDNDRDLDLAVGNTSGSQVYVNQGSTPGSPRFLWLWRSNEANNVQGVAWGDVDGDGDLDLAVAGTDISGYYDNNYVAPAHLGLNYRPLPLNSAYLSIERPVPAEGQIWYRKLLTDPTSLQIPVNFTIYDPDGTHQNGVRSNASIANGNVISIAFEYSLNGGGSWQPANGDWNSSNPTDVFTWIAGQDLNGVEEAVSDIIRLRISIIHKNKTGQLQRAKTSAISPPIRVRNLSCVWPEETSFSYQPTTVTAGESVQFLATTIGGGDEEFGQIIFVWDFGDTMTATGHLAQHTYATAGTYTVTLTANGAACPIARSESVTQTLVVGVHILENPVYLPVILKSSSGGSTAGVSGGIGILNINADSPARVTGLVGHVSSGATTLRWEAAAPEDGAAGYRLYGSPAGTIAFQRLAELPVDVTTYTDAATCGQMYFVTAYNASGESLPSTASYFSPPCQ